MQPLARFYYATINSARGVNRRGRNAIVMDRELANDHGLARWHALRTKTAIPRINSVLLAALLIAGGPALVWAQSGRVTARQSEPLHPGVERPDTIIGRVTDTTGTPIGSVDIHVTRAPDRFAIETQTDNLGNYRIIARSESGDYLVYFAAAGFRSLRKRVTRVPGNSAALIVNATMQRAVTALAAVVTEAARPAPKHKESDVPELEGVETVVGGVPAALSPGTAGDITSLAATVPGVTATPKGLSILGLPADQSNVTLNGAVFSGSRLPRLARTTARVATSTYDPSRGGFGAGQLAIELAPGYSFSSRYMSIAGSPGVTQLSDAALSNLSRGQPSYLSASIGADGPLLDSEKWTYSASADVAYRTLSASSLGGSPTSAYGALGVDKFALDSALTGLARYGLLGAPLQRASDKRVTAMARVDHTPNGATRWGLLGYLDADQTLGVGNAPFVSSSRARTDDMLTAMAMLTSSTLIRKRVLSESRFTVSLKRLGDRPNQPGPASIITVAPSDTEQAATIQAGGGVPFNTSEWLVEGTNETQWYATNRNRIKVGVDALLQGSSGTRSSDANGTFYFASPSDLTAGHASLFSRTLNSSGGDATVWNAAAFLGDWWHPAAGVELVGGLRLEGGSLLSRLPQNLPLVAALGPLARNGSAAWGGVSPRLGFSWLYGSPSPGSTISNLGTFLDGPKGVLRGGIGAFRSNLPANVAEPLSVETGLSSAARELTCAGAATPPADWTRYNIDIATVPQSCVAGAPSLAVSGLPVALLGREYRPPMSWRSTLGWSGLVKTIPVSVDGVYSWQLNQPSRVDLNFTGVPQFTLPAEANRPVFSPVDAIDARTGFSVPTGARQSTEFSGVNVLQSDLRGHAAQVTVVATPPVGSDRVLRASYTLGRATTQVRGFDGATGDDPRSVQEEPSPLDVRHQIQVEFGTSLPHGVSATVYSKVRSGLHYTPIVNGDVNGDGIGGDRAFVLGPSSIDSRTGAAIAALMKRSSTAAACLQAQVNQLAALNSCHGPWAITADLRLALSPAALSLGDRVTAALYFQNLPALADHAIHGTHTHGWGQQSIPDPVLLSVNGFDATTKQWRYTTNAGFGSTRLNMQSLTPFSVTAEINIDIGMPLPEQLLKHSLDAGRRGHSGRKMDADQIAARYERTVPNLFADLVEASDSLLLSPPQLKALQDADDTYLAGVRPEWRALANYLAGLPDDYSTNKALDRITETTARVWVITQRDAQQIRTILNPLQLRLAPGIVTYVLNAKGPIKFRLTPAR
ncbi:MAG: carboxypeptidase-like regulatory domain-containing protein [Gemmatimonadaceae bacterium]